MTYHIEHIKALRHWMLDSFPDTITTQQIEAATWVAERLHIHSGLGIHAFPQQPEGGIMLSLDSPYITSSIYIGPQEDERGYWATIDITNLAFGNSFHDYLGPFQNERELGELFWDSPDYDESPSVSMQIRRVTDIDQRALQKAFYHSDYVGHEIREAIICHPSDYEPWGLRSNNDRGADCSMGCRWFVELTGDHGLDYGVCTGLHSPRCGMLTFEHQNGWSCFESDPNETEDEEIED